MMPALRVGGAWLNSIGPAGQLVYGWLADGGCGDATWSMNLPQTYAHPALRRGKIVEVRAGSKNVYMGMLSAPEVNVDSTGLATWKFTAQGLKEQGKSFLCLDGSGNTSTNPDTCIDQAISRGLPWKRPVSISSSNFNTSGATNAMNYLTDLLDPHALSVSKRWGVDADGNVYEAADDTSPTWHMVPGSGRFGLADDNYASTVYVRYLNGTTYTHVSASDAVAAATYGVREAVFDVTGFGSLSSGQVSGMAAGVIAKGKPRLAWTNSLRPSPFQLTTSSGAPAPGWMVRPQQMVRLHGVQNEQGQPLPYVDFVIGETSYNPLTNELVLTPSVTAPRDLNAVIQSMRAA